MNAEDSGPPRLVEPRSRRRSRSFFLWMVGLLFVYCLSIGPVWKLRDKTNRLYGWGDMVDYAYFPIFICMLNYGDTPPGRFFLRYVYDVWKCRPPLLKGLG